MKSLFHKYKHAWVFLYALIYFPWFCYLEKHITNDFHTVHFWLDDKIPFIEYFIVPYLLWFGFIAAAALYFFFTDKSGFYRMMLFMVTGMTIFLIISTLYPNGLDLRPASFPRENLFTDLVKHLYSIDTPTNVFPSIHVYNALAVHIAVRESARLRKKKPVLYGSFILAVLIILSTMFLKQHSVIDVAGALIMALPAFHLAYGRAPMRSARPSARSTITSIL